MGYGCIFFSDSMINESIDIVAGSGTNCIIFITRVNITVMRSRHKFSALLNFDQSGYHNSYRIFV